MGKRSKVTADQIMKILRQKEKKKQILVRVPHLTWQKAAQISWPSTRAHITEWEKHQLGRTLYSSNVDYRNVKHSLRPPAKKSGRIYFYQTLNTWRECFRLEGKLMKKKLTIHRQKSTTWRNSFSVNPETETARVQESLKEAPRLKQ